MSVQSDPPVADRLHQRVSYGGDGSYYSRLPGGRPGIFHNKRETHMTDKSTGRLDTAKIFKLGTWMTEQHDRPDWGLIENRAGLDGARFDEVAAAATEALGFDVSESNVKSVATSLDIQWDRPARERGSSGVMTRLAALEEANAGLVEQLAALQSRCDELEVRCTSLETKKPARGKATS